MPDEARRQAIKSALERGMFDAVVFGNHFWLLDPTDAVSVHAAAREKFDRLLTADTVGGSKTLLLVGETGAGKTHLLRVMRATAAARGSICAYAQFNAQGGDYLRHFLKRLVDSLGEKFEAADGVTTGFAQFFKLCRACDPRAIDRLEACWSDDDLSEDLKRRAVGDAADRILPKLELVPGDLSVAKALLYANSPSFAVQARARQFLAGEPLSDFDREHVPDLPLHREAALRQPLFTSLARVLSAGAGPLIYFFDQAEALTNQGEEGALKALNVIVDLLDSSPHAAAVIAWERSSYDIYFHALPDFLKDRMNNGLTAILARERSTTEIREIIGARLGYWLPVAGVSVDPENSLYPLPESWPAEHARLRTREVLISARESTEQVLGESPGVGALPGELEDMDTRWEAAHDESLSGPVADDAVLDLLVWACCNARFEGLSASGRNIAVSSVPASANLDIAGGTDAGLTQLFVLSGSLRGGGMLGRVNAAIQQKQGCRVVAIRLDAFPANVASQTAQRLLELLSPEGVKIQPTPEDLRRLGAYRKFVGEQQGKRGFVDWALQARVIEASESIRGILGVPESGVSGREIPGQHEGGQHLALAKIPEARPTPETQTPQTGRIDGLALGRQLDGSPVFLNPQILTKHAAVLGGSGSGKTTLILSIVEKLALLGIPSVLVDRKGDFASYGNKNCWQGPLAEELEQRRRQLRDHLDVTVYTPGKTAGRHLALRLLPGDIAELPGEEKRDASRASAEALSDMIRLKGTATDTQRREVLVQAVEQAAREFGADVDLGHLVQVLHEGAPGLQDVLRYLDPESKHRRALAPMLEQLRLARGTLFDPAGEQLDFASLIGQSDGRTRLAIISLAFLPEVSDQQFYVSRLLSEARRFCRQRPSAQLQCALVLDEADLYMPVQSKPATKEPMLDLLRRARSGGMGLILGTQSPADLDYRGRDNITTWALGRIQARTAIDKVTFAAEGTAFDLPSLLPTFTTGCFFFRSEGFCGQVQVERNLVATRQLGEEEIIQAARSGLGRK
jgi:hypothetical protein